MTEEETSARPTPSGNYVDLTESLTTTSLVVTHSGVDGSNVYCTIQIPETVETVGFYIDGSSPE